MNLGYLTLIALAASALISPVNVLACSISKSANDVARYYAQEDSAKGYVVAESGTSVEVDGKNAVVIGFVYSVKGSQFIGEATIDKATCNTLRTSIDLTMTSSTN